MIRKAMVSADLCERALDEVRLLEYHPLFCNVYSKTDDLYRRKVDLQPLRIGKIVP